MNHELRNFGRYDGKKILIGEVIMNFVMNTYMISNRVNKADCSPPGPVLYLKNNNFPSQMYNELLSQSTVDRAAWIDALTIDLYNLHKDKNRPVGLAFYIHGFDLSANDARISQACYGSRLYVTGHDQGLVVGASWPSNCDFPSTGRQYAEDSANLMTAILDVIPLVRAALQSKYGAGAPKLATAVITHSMGNYLMSTTLASGKVPNYRNAVDQVLMLAPDVSNSIFQQGASDSNQGQAIYDMAGGNVWVFWTWNDRVLEADEYAGNWKVLGYRGPELPISRGTPKVQFIDSGNVANYDNGEQYVPYVYGMAAIVHSSYRFVTQLVFWQTVLLRTGAADETLQELIDATRLKLSAAPAEPIHAPLDAYLYRNIRMHRYDEKCGGKEIIGGER